MRCTGSDQDILNWKLDLKTELKLEAIVRYRETIETFVKAPEAFRFVSTNRVVSLTVPSRAHRMLSDRLFLVLA